MEILETMIIAVFCYYLYLHRRGKYGKREFQNFQPPWKLLSLFAKHKNYLHICTEKIGGRGCFFFINKLQFKEIYICLDRLAIIQS